MENNIRKILLSAAMLSAVPALCDDNHNVTLMNNIKKSRAYIYATYTSANPDSSIVNAGRILEKSIEGWAAEHAKGGAKKLSPDVLSSAIDTLFIRCVNMSSTFLFAHKKNLIQLYIKNGVKITDEDANGPVVDIGDAAGSRRDLEAFANRSNGGGNAAATSGGNGAATGGGSASSSSGAGNAIDGGSTDVQLAPDGMPDYLVEQEARQSNGGNAGSSNNDSAVKPPSAGVLSGTGSASVSSGAGSVSTGTGNRASGNSGSASASSGAGSTANTPDLSLLRPPSSGVTMSSEASSALKKIASIKSFFDLQKVMEPLKQQGVITDYGKYATMKEPAQSYLIIYDLAGNIKAVLGKDRGEGVRTNLNTHKDDGTANYKGCGALWFKLKK